MNLTLTMLSGAKTGTLRTANDQLIVPVVALVGDLVIHAVNAQSAELVPLAALQKAATAWNDKPVTLGHPVSSGKQCSADSPEGRALQIGVVRDAQVRNGRLVVNFHIDQARLKVLSPKTAQRFTDGELIDVSVGAFVSVARQSGISGGKRYEGVWQDITPDHIAVLESQRGACSCSDGCGTFQRVAAGYQFDAPDPYAIQIATLRAATATERTRFEGAFMAARVADLAAERDHFAQRT